MFPITFLAEHCTELIGLVHKWQNNFLSNHNPPPLYYNMCRYYPINQSTFGITKKQQTRAVPDFFSNLAWAGLCWIWNRPEPDFQIDCNFTNLMCKTLRTYEWFEFLIIFCTAVTVNMTLWSAAPNRTTSSYFDRTEKKTHAVWSSGQNGRVSRRQENSDCSSQGWVEKASWATLHLLDGHSEERPSSAQPYLGGCYRTGSE